MLLLFQTYPANHPTSLHYATFPELEPMDSCSIETPLLPGSICTAQYNNFLYLFAVDNRSFAPVSLNFARRTYIQDDGTSLLLEGPVIPKS